MTDTAPSIVDARQKLLSFLPTGSSIISSTVRDGDVLFLVAIKDEVEGRFDPFFIVKSDGEVRDFSPQDYPDSLKILQDLDAV